MTITVASGKGGTGKTTVAVGLALIAEQVQLLDCDAEEPNAHLFVKPALDGSAPVTIMVPEIDTTQCDLCGKCSKTCQFNAVAVLANNALVFPELCHGCGACALACPRGAIREVPLQIGVVERGKAGEIDFIQGRLNIGESMATPIIKAVKSHMDEQPLTIIDAAPGTACPVVEAVKESDFCLLVTEPTPFGLSDLSLAIEMTKKLGVPSGVVINRSGEGDEATEEFCRRNGLPLLGRIPFDRRIAEAYARGIHPVHALSKFRQRLKTILNHTLEQASGVRS